MPAHFCLVCVKIVFGNPHTYLVKTGSKLKSRADFSRGEVAFLLSQGKDEEFWEQNEIAEYDYVYCPVLNGKKVYKYCNGEDKYTIRF